MNRFGRAYRNFGGETCAENARVRGGRLRLQRPLPLDTLSAQVLIGIDSEKATVTTKRLQKEAVVNQPASVAVCSDMCKGVVNVVESPVREAIPNPRESSFAYRTTTMISNRTNEFLAT